MTATARDYREFKQTVWDYYHTVKRSMPWRVTSDPYQILVSEVMLQQTQVRRVIPKFETFIRAFPDFSRLQQASFAEVLTLWQGLGYNRRAQYLQRTATMITKNGWDTNATFPTDPTKLATLPGIGLNTAAAIIVYTHNLPLVFIETNIRTVYLHHFFPNIEGVEDSSLLEIIEQTLDHDNPREWYWALMDYGTFLKSNHKNPSRRSKHHVTQTAFEGSTRQIRGKILKLLTQEPADYLTLQSEINDKRFKLVLDKLIGEKMIVRNGDVLSLE